MHEHDQGREKKRKRKRHQKCRAKKRCKQEMMWVSFENLNDHGGKAGHGFLSKDSSDMDSSNSSSSSDSRNYEREGIMGKDSGKQRVWGGMKLIIITNYLIIIITTITTAIIVFVGVIITGTKIIMCNPVVPLKILDPNIFRVKDCINLIILTNSIQ